MENKSSYTIVGIFVILAVVGVVSFFWWITTKTDPNLNYSAYYIHTKELPSGLKEGSQVKYIGVPAGIVKKIRFEKDSDFGTIEIELKLQSNFPIKKDSLARVEIQGLSGIANLNITKGVGEGFKDGEKPILKLDFGLFSKAENIGEKITVSLEKLNLLFSDENLANLSQTLESINSITKKLDDNESSTKISSILASTDSILKEFDQNKTQIASNLDKLIKNSDKFILSWTMTSATLNRTLKLVNSDMEKGNYNLKDMINPTLHEATLSLIELKKVLREFQSSLFRLEDNPYDFFFRDTTQKEKR
ncbi:MlaD family protein [Campylobacter geochelonis]|uniref:Putative ABC transport system periplasmic substrate-binding protein n=1 Tax=Campylobacter geochelonis TaxID=1780362 RepID=A0A128EPI4_9BACT|nr:MlaD family protein [Campylobacter geochelonis]QKF71325.1 lipid asymmetry ABC transporter MlaABCDEF, periplasmic component MlaD [Campylobacter geochelonis]CZE48039.1 putative ABC transport system periplasmic substrate-binding protein [Campylobacter geochelonis]CZE48212.1 putative ABC transport system periplasmic substrate-binding protein [Campylobacter geochelonis]CZE51057.1 putative ABC transport system periplasmic substrate-binding protein [Campylobacter geochelonis]